MSSLLQLVEKFYCAAAEEGLWEIALENLKEYFGAEYATMVMPDDCESVDSYINTSSNQIIIDEYELYYKYISPRLRCFKNDTKNKIFFDYMHTDEEEIKRDEYYNWINGWGCKYYIGGRATDDRERDSFVAVHFASNQPHVDRRIVREFAVVLSHVEHALKIRRQFRELRLDQAAAWAIINHSPRGIVALNAELCVVHTNSEARRILAHNDGLRLSGGRIIASNRASRIALRQAMMAMATAVMDRTALPQPPALSPSSGSTSRCL